MLLKRKQFSFFIIQTLVCLTVWQIKHSSAICSNQSTRTFSSNNRSVLLTVRSPGESEDSQTTTKNFNSTKDATTTGSRDGDATHHRCPEQILPTLSHTDSTDTNNRTDFNGLSNDLRSRTVVKRSIKSTAIQKINNDGKSKELDQKLKKSVSNRSNARAVESGRFFFFKGLKKMMWGLFVGLQVVKTVLLALFLPSILGSLGKMVGKGLSSVSGYNHPSETVSDLDFKDDTYNLDQEGYNYPQGESSNTNFVTQMYESGMAYNKNANPLSRFGVGDQKLTHVNSMLANYGPKNTNTDIMSSTATKNNFGDFLDIPASSLLLTNYDPFYSPLLSRLDAVFQQLGLPTDNEVCRKKLVCFMYSNPAKYAPYSNLVSAQLSRELNELRKPTVDNPNILRFFQYMKAAKDGQDGTDCNVMYSDCTSLKDTENPVMLTTFNDINKLVQARKFQ